MIIHMSCLSYEGRIYQSTKELSFKTGELPFLDNPIIFQATLELHD